MTAETPTPTEAGSGEREVAARHCASCTCGRRAPVQGEYASPRGDAKAAGTIAWEEHIEAYAQYAARFGTSQSAERLAERGGFGYRELQDFLGRDPVTWRPGR